MRLADHPQSLLGLSSGAGRETIRSAINLSLGRDVSGGPGRQAGVLGEQTTFGRLGARRRAVFSTGTDIGAIRERLEGRDQMVLAVTDQVRTAHGFERFTQQRPMLGIVVAQKSLVQTTATLPAHDVHTFAGVTDLAQGVLARVVHGGGQSHRCGQKGLHLVGSKAIALAPKRKRHHVPQGGARVRGDEIGNEILFLARLAREAFKQHAELLEGSNAGLSHLFERPGLTVLRRDLEVATHMVLDQLFDVGGRGQR